RPSKLKGDESSNLIDDCLSLLADNDELISRIFVEVEVNINGIFVEIEGIEGECE
ncbi:35842_t:CDS:1, partial [Racocetra persica]